MNLDELKQNIIDYMGTVKLEELSMEELRTYADTMRIVNDLFKKDTFEQILTAMTVNGRGFAGYQSPMVSTEGLAIAKA